MRLRAGDRDEYEVLADPVCCQRFHPLQNTAAITATENQRLQVDILEVSQARTIPISEDSEDAKRAGIHGSNNEVANYSCPL
jgi:hypothetical protein